MLETASAHAQSMANEKWRKASTEYGADSSIYEDYSNNQKDLEKLIEDNKRYADEIVECEKRIAEINKILDSVKPIQLKQQERSRLEADLHRYEEQKKAFLVKRNNFIINYTILLNYYPLIESTLNMILEKEKSGSLPPDIDKKLLKKILKEHITTCPVCKNTIDQHSVLEIQKLIDTLDVDSGTSNKLMEIKGYLEEALSKSKNYQNEKRFVNSCHNIILLSVSISPNFPRIYSHSDNKIQKNNEVSI